jgi:RNA polymerase sigma-70 factor (ECF subfamily)
MTEAADATALCTGGGLDAPSPRCVDADATVAGPDRVRLIVRAHYASLWRFLRRLGVHETSVEDAAQQVLCVVARRIDEIAAGTEKTFLFSVAVRVAHEVRREQQRPVCLDGDDLLAEVAASAPEPGEALDDRRARAVLDAILETMPLELRTVFVLYELDEMTMAEIALALAIPPGTVASRLRRARAAFTALSRRAQARMATGAARGKP